MQLWIDVDFIAKINWDFSFKHNGFWIQVLKKSDRSIQMLYINEAHLHT